MDYYYSSSGGVIWMGFTNFSSEGKPTVIRITRRNRARELGFLVGFIK